MPIPKYGQGDIRGVRGEGPVLIGIDVGTSSLRSIAFDVRGRRIAAAIRPTPTRVVETGGEYDPEAIFSAVLETLAELGATLRGRPVSGISVASVGESCVLIGADGRSLAPSIVWHYRRTEPQARKIEEIVGPERIFEIIGHKVEPIYTLAKLLWMHEYWPDAFQKAVHVLMMADWIAYRLSGEFATDPSLASRTCYFDLRQGRWSEELMATSSVAPNFPAPLARSGTALGPIQSEIFAATKFSGRAIVAVGGHDHIIGALATGLNHPGSAVNSIGTAEALLVATEQPLSDPRILQRGYVQGAIEVDHKLFYIAGALLSSGGAFEWVRSIAGNPPLDRIISNASKVPVGSGGVVFLPHLANGPPPVPDIYARGAFFGLTQTTTLAALYRATLEGVAMQSRMMLDGMTGLPGVGSAREIRLIGGAARNSLFLSIKANVFGRDLIVVEEPEATALGAALLAGVASGVFPSFEAGWLGLERKEFHVLPDPEAVERYEKLRTRIFAPAAPQMRPINRTIADFAAGR